MADFPTRPSATPGTSSSGSTVTVGDATRTRVSFAPGGAEVGYVNASGQLYISADAATGILGMDTGHYESWASGQFVKWLIASTTVMQVNDLGIPSFRRGANVASDTTIVPTAFLFHVTGTNAVATITVPSFVNSGAAICIIPDGLFTWTNGGNIAIAGSAVVNKALWMSWDATASKWYPSYLS